MSVHKDNNRGTWYVKYKNSTHRGFKTKSEASRYETKLKFENNTPTNAIDFKNLCNEYLNYYKTNVSISTYKRQENIIKNIILPNVVNKKISLFTNVDIKKFRENIFSLKYSTKYKNDILNQFKRLFDYAIKFHDLNKNPCNVLEPFKKTTDEKIESNNHKYNVWSYDEFNTFISFVKQPNYKLFLTLLYFTGLRLGEAQALKWCDFKGDYLTINKTISKYTNGGYYGIKEPKTPSSIRDVYLNSKLIELLNDLKIKESSIPGFSEDWFIFGRLNPLPRTSIDRIKNLAIKESKVKKIRLHDFRHSHASNLISSGVNIVEVSHRLGHSTTDMTLRVYTHFIKPKDNYLLDCLDKNFSQSSQNKNKT